MGIATKYHEVTSGNFAGAFSAILQDQPDVLYVGPDIFIHTPIGSPPCAGRRGMFRKEGVDGTPCERGESVPPRRTRRQLCLQYADRGSIPSSERAPLFRCPTTID
jgi:hypothetical protein